MKKIKAKDVPSICPRCGGWLAEAWCGAYVLLECIGKGPDFEGCGWSEEYELLPVCRWCKFYKCDERIVEYEDGEKVCLLTNERCSLHGRPTTWDDSCPDFEEVDE